MKKLKKEYTNDELGELIIPRQLTEEDRKIFKAAIAADKKKNKFPLVSRKRKLTV